MDGKAGCSGPIRSCSEVKKILQNFLHFNNIWSLHFNNIWSLRCNQPSCRFIRSVKDDFKTTLDGGFKPINGCVQLKPGEDSIDINVRPEVVYRWYVRLLAIMFYNLHGS